MQLSLGCMNFGKRTPEAEARRIVDRAIERGITHFDTASSYGEGASEEILGRALAGRRAGLVVATKAGCMRRGGRAEGLSAATIARAADESLSRLGVERIDLFYLHAPDRAVPVEESLGACAALQRAGKIDRIGVSNYAAWEILAMGPRPEVAQQPYNLLFRDLDVEYFRFAERYAIHTTVYNPLAGGLLALAADGDRDGPRLRDSTLYQRRYGSARMRERAAAYRALAAEYGLSLLELAYAWLAGRAGVSSILVGPASVQHLDAAIDAAARCLGPAACARIDALQRELAGTDATYAR